MYSIPVLINFYRSFSATDIGVGRLSVSSPFLEISAAVAVRNP